MTGHNKKGVERGEEMHQTEDMELTERAILAQFAVLHFMLAKDEWLRPNVVPQFKYVEENLEVGTMHDTRRSN